MNIASSITTIVGLGIALSACSGTNNKDAESFQFKDAQRYDFSSITFDENSALITNPYLAFYVGRKTFFEGTTDEGLERIEIEVLSNTKTINGVDCAIVLVCPRHQRHGLVYGRVV